MTGEQVYVSHAPADLGVVEEVVGTVRNFPFDTYVAMEEVEPGRNRENLAGRVANSDVVVAVLTADGAGDQWVNQEVGYASARGVPVLPLYESPDHRGGYLHRVEGVELDRENLSVTAFNLLCRLRAELAPLGALSEPTWFVRFPCGADGCDAAVTLEIEQRQKDLWRMREHGETLRARCGDCGAAYHFEPATMGFLGRGEESSRDDAGA